MYHMNPGFELSEEEIRSRLEERHERSYKEALSEIKYLRHKISQLEVSLNQADVKTSKAFPEVKFKNYKDRKRILVRVATKIPLNS